MSQVFMGNESTDSDFMVQTIASDAKVVAELVTLESIIQDVKHLKYKAEIDAYRNALQTATTKEEKSAIKKEDYIPSFMPHGLVAHRVKLKKHGGDFNHDGWLSTGIVHMDLDKIPSNQMHNVIKKIDALQPLARFKSPSGNGLKVFFQHDCGDLDETQRQNFRNALRRCIRRIIIELGLDSAFYDYSPTNANRQCYLSYDSTAVYNSTHRLFPLSKGFAEMDELHNERANLEEELKSLVCVVKNVVDLTARDKHIEDHFQRRVASCSGNGNTQSYALACEMVRSGYDVAQMTATLQRFKGAVNGDWDVQEKVSSAISDVGTERNRYSSETIQVDAKIDTARFNAIRDRLAIIDSDLAAKTAHMNYEITNPLALSMINQSLPIETNLVRNVAEYAEQAQAIYHAVQVSKVVTVVENAGSGKSTTIGELAKIIKGDIECNDKTWKGMVFATNTRANRDAFAMHNTSTGFVIVKGVTEIISENAADPAAPLRAAQLYEEDFDLEDKRNVVGTLVEEGLLTELEAKAIRAACRKNAERLKEPFLAICHAKMRCGGLVTRFMRHVVVMDEMAADDVVALTDTDKCIAYGKVEVKVQENDLTSEEEVKFFIDKISQRQDADGNSIGGVVMLSAEKSLLRAFGSSEMPNMRIKGMFGNITVKHLGKPRTLVDNNLSIVVVDSLGNNTEGQKVAYCTPRDKMAKALRSEGYYVICDGKRKDGSQIGDETIEGCKGSNGLMTKKTAVLIAPPHPFEIGLMMMRLSCDEATAISVIVSDKANQAIGRNVGYRNRGAECLLVVAAGVHSAEKTLTLDVISNNCFVVRKREDVDHIPTKLQGIFSAYLDTDDAVCFKVAMGLYNQIFCLGEEVNAKDLKDVIREELTTNGVATRRIANGGLVAKTIIQLNQLGVTVHIKYTKVNGKKTSCTVYAVSK